MRPDASFCGQCYADFRPPPPPPVYAAPTAPAPGASYGTPAPDPLTAPLLDVVLPAAAPAAPAAALPVVPAQAEAPAAEAPVAAPVAPAPAAAKLPTWPCTRCDAMNDLDSPHCAACGSPFLAAVSESSKVSLVLPVVGDLNKYSRGQRALIAVGAMLALLAPLALITLLLTDSPPPSNPGPATGPAVEQPVTTTEVVPAG